MKTTGVVVLSPSSHQAHRQNYIALREGVKAITQSFHGKQTSKKKLKNKKIFLPFFQNNQRGFFSDVLDK